MRAASTLLDLVYPRQCAGCGDAMGPHHGHICWECARTMDLISDPICRVCGDPAEGAVDHHYTCFACVGKRPAYNGARSAARYRGTLRRVLRDFKYNKASHLRADLAVLLHACARTHYATMPFDGVIGVPLYPRRERERTYNQAALLAGALAAKLRLPCPGHFLRRLRPTATQTRLSATERRANVRGAFGTRGDAWIKGRRILLVDDVMTTGATVDECSAALKAAGAAGVCVVTVARG